MNHRSVVSPMLMPISTEIQLETEMMEDKPSVTFVLSVRLKASSSMPSRYRRKRKKIVFGGCGSSCAVLYLKACYTFIVSQTAYSGNHFIVLRVCHLL